MACDHAEQGGFACAVTANDADDRPRRNGEGNIFVEQAITKSFADTFHFYDLVAQTGSGRDIDLVGFVALLEILRAHFFETGKAGFALRLPAFGVATHPLQLLFDGFLARSFLFGFCTQALFLVFQPLAIVAFKRDALAPVELQNPACYVVEEVAVVGNGNYGAFVIVQEALQPGDGFCVQMVGGLIQQKHVRARE